MQEITFKDIYNTLLPKLKVLLVILLIGAVVGGCVGVARTYASITYGTKIEFYVNPKMSDEGSENQSQFGVYGAYGWHVMDNMTKLLASESFAEKMLLDENGLPIETVLAKETDRAALDAKIAEAKAAITEVENAKAAESETSKEQLAELEAAAQEKVSAAIDLWRQSEVYSEYVAMITESVKYSFYNDSDIKVNNTDALAKSFIYVDISTTENEETANFIYERINEVLPIFVEANMAIPSGYIGTNCQRITRLDEIRQTNSDGLLGSAIKYAVVLGILALLLSMAFIVFIDRFKKWSALNKSATGAELNASDVTLGDGEVRPTSDKGE